jgi:hypothetical protein
MGYVAVKSLLKGDKSMATAYVGGQVITIPLEKSLGKKDKYLPQFVDLARALSI